MILWKRLNATLLITPTILWLTLVAFPTQARDALGDETALEIPQQISPVLENSTYLYYFESDDALLTSSRSKLYSFGTLPEEEVTILVYGLDKLVIPQLALYDADGTLILSDDGTSNTNRYTAQLKFVADEKELLFFEVTRKNNTGGLVRVMLFEGKPFDDDLTLLDTINPLLPGRAFMVAGDHIEDAIVGLDVAVEVLPVPRFDDERPEVFASRGTFTTFPPDTERFNADDYRSWSNTPDVEIYTINVRAAPEPPTSVSRIKIAENNYKNANYQSLNLNSFFYFEYHLIIGKGSTPQPLIRGDECQTNPNRPECIRSTGEPSGRTDDSARDTVPIRNEPAAPPTLEIIEGVPVTAAPDDEAQPGAIVPPTVTYFCPLGDPFNAANINIINDNDTGNPNLGGTGCRDIINGLGGNDVIDGGIMPDELYGGDGDDTFFDSDSLDGYAFGGYADDSFYGGAGTDTLEYTPLNYYYNYSNFYYDYYYGYFVSYNYTSQTYGIVNYDGNGQGTTVLRYTSDNYQYLPSFSYSHYESDDEINQFYEMENITTGGSGSETFNITPDDIGNIFDGGLGSDTISYAASGADLRFDVSGTTSVIRYDYNPAPLIDEFSYDAPLNFETYVGSAGVDTLNIMDTSTTTGPVSALVDPTPPDVTSSVPTTYNLGGGDDIINMNNTGSVAVTINGGAGNEIFTITGFETNVDTFIGGTDNDELIYDPGYPVPLLVNYNTTSCTPFLPAVPAPTSCGTIRNETTNDILDRFWDMETITTGNLDDVFAIEGDTNATTFDAGENGTNTDADTANYAPSTAAMTFTLNSLTNIIQADMGGGIDTLLNFETLIGTSHDDIFNISQTAASGTTLNGGGGNDTFNVTPDGFAGAVFDGGGGTADQLNISNNFDAVNIEYAALNTVEFVTNGGTNADTARNFENITTGDGADTFLVTPDNVDNIFGGAGGFDVYTVNGNTAVTVNLGAGDPEVVGAGGTDILQNIENITTGAGNDIFNININDHDTELHLNGGTGNNLFVFTGTANPTADGILHIYTSGGVDWLDFSQVGGASGLTINMGNTLGLQTVFGNFQIFLHNAINNLTGTNQADNIIGSAGNDTIDAGGGNDIVGDPFNGGQNANNAGNDTIYGGLGNDTLYGGDGTDIIYGGAACGGLAAPPANSAILAVPAASTDGSDTIVGGTGNDTLYGGNNNSTNTNAHNCNDAGDTAITDTNSGDTDIVYGGNNNTGGGTGTDGTDTTISVDENPDPPDLADTAATGNNNTGGGTGTDTGATTFAGDSNDTLTNGNVGP